jgi:hypothetical protein
VLVFQVIEYFIWYTACTILLFTSSSYCIYLISGMCDNYIRANSLLPGSDFIEQSDRNRELQHQLYISYRSVGRQIYGSLVFAKLTSVFGMKSMVF